MYLRFSKILIRKRWENILKVYLQTVFIKRSFLGLNFISSGDHVGSSNRENRHYPFFLSLSVMVEFIHLQGGLPTCPSRMQQNKTEIRVLGHKPHPDHKCNQGVQLLWASHLKMGLMLSVSTSQVHWVPGR